MKASKRAVSGQSGLLKEKLTETVEGKLLWNQEAAILDTTNLICELMEEEGISRAELARRMGKTKGYITQLLDGSANMTIRTVSDVFTLLGHVFKPTCAAREISGKFSTMVKREFVVSGNVEILDEKTPSVFSFNEPLPQVEPGHSIGLWNADIARAQLTA